MSENNNKCNICGESSPYYECSSCIAKDPYIPISKVKELIEKKSFIASWQMDVDHAKTIAFTGYGGIIKIEDLKNLIKGAEGG